MFPSPLVSPGIIRQAPLYRHCAGDLRAECAPSDPGYRMPAHISWTARPVVRSGIPARHRCHRICADVEAVGLGDPHRPGAEVGRRLSSPGPPCWSEDYIATSRERAHRTGYSFPGRGAELPTPFVIAVAGSVAVAGKSTTARSSPTCQPFSGHFMWTQTTDGFLLPTGSSRSAVSWPRKRVSPEFHDRRSPLDLSRREVRQRARPGAGLLPHGSRHRAGIGTSR